MGSTQRRASTDTCGHSSGISFIAFSHDSTRLASSSNGETIKIWDISKSVPQTFYSHADWVEAVAFSHDSTKLASASSDNTVKIWNMSGACLQTLEGYDCLEMSITFSPDSNKLALESKDEVSEDDMVKIWEMSGGAYLLTHEFDQRLPQSYFDYTGPCFWKESAVPASDSSQDSSSIDTEETMSLQPLGAGVSSDRIWITHEGKNMIWLPVEYRPECSSVTLDGHTIGIGTTSGRVWQCRFDPEVWSKTE
jgi:WD40 repeat protein